MTGSCGSWSPSEKAGALDTGRRLVPSTGLPQMARPVIRYAITADGLEIAYQVLGDGPLERRHRARAYLQPRPRRPVPFLRRLSPALPALRAHDHARQARLRPLDARAG